MAPENHKPKVEILEQHGHHFLWIDDDLWMWDLKEERAYQKRIAEEAYGDVLVAGMGLYVLQGYLQDNPKVTAIVTVEKYSEVCLEYERHFGHRVGMADREVIFLEDFYDFPPSDRSLEALYSSTDLEPIGQFDCVIGDIWLDVDEECLPDYLRFRDHARTLIKPGGKILAWGQDYFEFLIKTKRIKSPREKAYDEVVQHGFSLPLLIGILKNYGRFLSSKEIAPGVTKEVYSADHLGPFLSYWKNGQFFCGSNVHYTYLKEDIKRIDEWGIDFTKRPLLGDDKKMAEILEPILLELKEKESA